MSEDNMEIVRRSLTALKAVADGVDVTDRASWVKLTATHFDETLVDPVHWQGFQSREAALSAAGLSE